MTESDSDTLQQFPCSFPIKMVGRADADFGDTAVALIEQHVGPVAADSVQTSKSRNGNFVSVTVTIEAQCREQLDNIYNDLSNHEEILIAL